MLVPVLRFNTAGTMKINASAQIIDRGLKRPSAIINIMAKAILIDGFSDYRISKN